MNSEPDHLIKIVPVLILVTGLLISAICEPLTRGKIKPNRTYGIRTKFAFSSEENWYKANKFGGRVFVRAGYLIALIGLMGLFLPNALVAVYSLAAALVIVTLILGSAAIILRGQAKDRPE